MWNIIVVYILLQLSGCASPPKLEVGTSQTKFTYHNSYEDRIHNVNVIGTLQVTSYQDIYEQANDSDYYLYLIIADVSINKDKVKAAMSAFSENFDNFDYTQSVSSSAIIPFIAPTKYPKDLLTLRNYSLALSRQVIVKYERDTEVTDAQIAIYGSSANLFDKDVTAVDVNAVDLTYYNPDEISQMIVSLRHAFEKSDPPQTCKKTFFISYCQNIIIGYPHILLSLREPELAIFGRQILSSITSFLPK